MKTINSFLFDGSTLLCDLPNSEFTTGGFIDELCRQYGYDENGLTVINNLRAWNLTISELTELLKCE